MVGQDLGRGGGGQLASLLVEMQAVPRELCTVFGPASGSLAGAQANC